MENIQKASLILGKRVREERKEKGLTQAELSELIDKTPETICHLENGMAATKLSTIDKLADVLNLEIYELFKEKDPLDLSKISGVRLELLQELEETDDETISLVLKLVRKLKD